MVLKLLKGTVYASSFFFSIYIAYSYVYVGHLDKILQELSAVDM